MIKGVSKAIKDEAKEPKVEFLSILLGTLGASLLGNLLTGKGVKSKIPGQGVIKMGEGTIRAGTKIFSVTSPLTNFKIQKYQIEPKFKGIYSRNNLPKIKDGAYIINLNEYRSAGTHWIVL